MTSPKLFNKNNFLKISSCLFAVAILIGFLSLTLSDTAMSLTISDKDREKIEELCRKETDSKDEASACFDGYVIGYQKGDKSICSQNYSGKAAKACSETGYKLGKDNKAKISDSDKPGKQSVKTGGKYPCGRDDPKTDEDERVFTKFDLGCTGASDNPILDMAFGIINFLTLGVGLVVTIFIIVNGVKYATSEGNPETTMKAKDGIRQALIALLIYIFTFALVQWLVPGGVFS